MARASNSCTDAGGKDSSYSKVRGYNPPFEDATYFSAQCRRQDLWNIFQVYAGQPVHQAQGLLHGVAGCIEHTATHWEMLQNAKKAERQLVIAWLDLENAYGSVRHMLTQFTLRWYHVPDEMLELLFRYYETIFLRVVTDEWSSKWFPLLIGAPQGCTASTIVFDVDFQIILDLHEWLTRKVHPGYTLSKTDIRICSPTYADDVELVADSPQACQKSIDAFQTALEWTQTMKAKAVKCRSLAFRRFNKGEKKSIFEKVQETQYSCFDPLLVIDNKNIGFIGNDDPPIFKYLGRFVQFDLKEDKIKKQLGEKLEKMLKLVDETPLEGRMKAWIVNHHVCSKLAWWLMVQNFSDTDAKKWQDHIHRRYRKWLV